MDKKTQQKLDLLRKIFLKNLPCKIAEIEQAEKRLEQEWNKKNLTDLQRLSHNLQGSSATFSLPLVSEAAKKLEEHVSSLLEKEFNFAEMQQLHQLIVEIKSLIKLK